MKYPTEYSDNPVSVEPWADDDLCPLPSRLRWMSSFLPVGELVLSGRKWANLAQQAAAVSPIPPSNPKRRITIRWAR